MMSRSFINIPDNSHLTEKQHTQNLKQLVQFHLGSGDTIGHHHVENPPVASPLHHPLRSDHHEKNASSHSLHA